MKKRISEEDEVQLYYIICRINIEYSCKADTEAMNLIFFL